MHSVARHIQIQECDEVLIKEDISGPSATTALFAQISSLTSATLDLVSNTGIRAPKATIQGLIPARLSAVFQVYTIGAIDVARDEVECVPAHKGGVNVSLTAACKAIANGYIEYAASKAAIETVTLGLAYEIASEGIRANALRPGLIETVIHAKDGVPDSSAQLPYTVPLGRAGTPQKVAATILWLISDEADHTTRSILDVAGGQ